MPIPGFNAIGDLPEGVYQATIDEVTARFGGVTSQRQAITTRLRLIYELTGATGKLERFIIFGSYITNKPQPNDVDIFLVMAEEFDVSAYTGETRDIFSHARAEHRFGASVFWVTRGSSFASINDLIAGWQTKRDQTRRGILEVVV